MATEIKESGLGQVDRLTLLDPGTKVSDFKVDGKIQQGLIHKVDFGMIVKIQYYLALNLIWLYVYIILYTKNRMTLLSLMFFTLLVSMAFGKSPLEMLTSGQMEEKINRRAFIQADTNHRYTFSQEPL